MSAKRNIIASLVMLASEPSYSGSVAVTGSTDVIQFKERPDFAINAYGMDGGRPSQMGTLYRNKPAGRTFSTTLKIDGKGTTAAQYLNTGTVPNVIHRMLLAAGYSGSFINSTSWQYNLQDPDFITGSLGGVVYEAGVSYPLAGIYADMKWSTQAGDEGIFEFDLKGLVGLPATATKPAYAFPWASLIPPNSTNIGMNINGYTTFKIRSVSFQLGRKIDARPDANSLNSHAGFAPGGRAPQLVVVMEREDLANYNPYAAYANATPTAVSFQLGSVSGNRYSFNAPSATLMGVKDMADSNNVATWELTYDLPDSTPLTYDGHTWTFS